MNGPRISDHALVQFLERAGGLNIEVLRDVLGSSLARAHAAARSIGDTDYLIKADGMTYVVRGDTVTAALTDLDRPGFRAQLLGAGQDDQQ